MLGVGIGALAIIIDAAPLVLLALVSFIVPPILIFNLFPTKGRVTLTQDRIHFAKSGEILFKDLISYQTDYQMNIHIKGQKYPITLGKCVSTSPQKDDISFEEWRDTFEKRMAEWQLHLLQTPFGEQHTASIPKKTHYFGSLCPSYGSRLHHLWLRLSLPLLENGSKPENPNLYHNFAPLWLVFNILDIAMM